MSSYSHWESQSSVRTMADCYTLGSAFSSSETLVAVAWFSSSETLVAVTCRSFRGLTVSKTPFKIVKWRMLQNYSQARNCSLYTAGCYFLGCTEYMQCMDEMQPIVTDVCGVSVCPSVMRLNSTSLFKNGWTDQDAVCSKHSREPKGHCVARGS